MVGLLQSKEHSCAVEESWTRCHHHPHLDSERGTSIMRLLDSEVRPRRDQLREALGDVQTEVEALAEIAFKADHCLVLTDRDSIVVDVLARQAEEAALSHAGISLGSCWSEKLAGTNGVALALEHSKAFTARGADHYLRNLRTFACTGVPLHDAEGGTMGVLTLSSIDKEHTGDYVLAQHLLTHTANRIEARLFLRAHTEHHVIAPRPDAPEGALVTLDGGANIIAATRATASMVNATTKLIGRPFEEVFNAPAPLRRPPKRVASLNGGSGRLPHSVSSVVGSDANANKAATRALHLLALGQPVAIHGAAGSGKLKFAEGLFKALAVPFTRFNGSALAARGAGEHLVSRWIEQTERLLVNNPRSGVLLDRLECLSDEALRMLVAWLSQLDQGSCLRGKKRRTAIIATLELADLPETLLPIFASHDVRLPNLRDRSDRMTLIRAISNRLSGDWSQLPRDVLNALDAYDWPGNLRELEAVLSQLFGLADGAELTSDLLPERIRETQSYVSMEPPSLQSALAATNWNVSRAARQMGISRATINRRIKEQGLIRPVFKSD